MLLTIAADISASDLGYLLRKNPARFHTFDLSFGKAHVFYPEVGGRSSDIALLLDIDPIGLVRGRSRANHGTALPGQAELLERLFVPLSYEVEAKGYHARIETSDRTWFAINLRSCGALSRVWNGRASATYTFSIARKESTPLSSSANRYME